MEDKILHIHSPKILKRYKFFWSGIFSNWYPSKFIVDGIEFNCGEQYMMYMKAMRFGDIETAREILNTTSPKEQKVLGRKVKNYDENIWAAERFKIVKEGLKEKFLQNPKLKEYLFKYKYFIIVEASPVDRVWGIGYHKDNPKIFEEKDKWGQNLLGKILMEIAKEIF